MKRFLVTYSVFGKDKTSYTTFLIASEISNAREKFYKSVDRFSGKYSLDEVCEVSKKDYGICK